MQPQTTRQSSRSSHPSVLSHTTRTAAALAACALLGFAHCTPEANGVGAMHPPPSPGADAGSGPPDAAPPPIARECSPARVLSSSSEPLINFFVTPDDIVVVRSRSISSYSRLGVLNRRIDSAREIKSAALSGDGLAVADTAVLTIYSPALAMLRQTDLKETCVASVATSGGRFICGPGNDWDRIFYSFDMNSATLVGQSAKYTYNGIPMRRVTGQDLFITTSISLSPSDYHLYRVNAAGVAEFVCESPYHGDFPVRDIFAFDKDAAHLVTHTGLLLKILGTGTNCSTYLLKDGVLGTLLSKESFLGMSDVGDGQIYSLVGSSDAFSALCQGGCKVQEIDVAKHEVVSEKSYSLPVARVLSTQVDRDCQSLVVGYQDDTGQYRVHTLPYR